MKSKTYQNLEDAYTELIGPLSRYDGNHLARKDYAYDAAHEAFFKALIYINKNKGAKISSFLLFRETIRACRRINKSHPFDQNYNEYLKNPEDEESARYPGAETDE